MRPPERSPPAAVGLDVGGGSVKALCWAPGAPVPTQTVRQRVDGRDATAVLALASALVADVAPADAGVVVGVALPGRIQRSGLVAQSPNLPWLDGVDARARFAEAISEAVPRATLSWLGNDATAAAVGEVQGSIDERRIGLWTIGTGVGGGLVIDGAPLLGAQGYAAELGHVPVRAGGPPCGCGGRGCLETYASVTALIQRAIDLGASDAPDPRGRGAAAEASGAGVSRVGWLSERLAQGDPAVRHVMQDAAELLANAMASVASLWSLDTVVLGGGGALLWPVWRPWLVAALDDACSALGLAHKPRLRVARLGPAAGALGAAVAARDAVRSAAAHAATSAR